MSFTSRIKNELIESELSKLEIVSELSGLLKNSAYISNKLNITTENVSIARFIFNKLKDNYDALIRVSVKKGYNYNKNYIYGLDVYRNSDLIIEDLSLNSIIPNSYLIDDEDTKRAYIRGVFLATGSVNDPKTSQYHMEFSFDNEEYANFINDILASYNLNSKVLKKRIKIYYIYKRIRTYYRFLTYY